MMKYSKYIFALSNCRQANNNLSLVAKQIQFYLLLYNPILFSWISKFMNILIFFFQYRIKINLCTEKIKQMFFSSDLKFQFLSIDIWVQLKIKSFQINLPSEAFLAEWNQDSRQVQADLFTCINWKLSQHYVT